MTQMAGWLPEDDPWGTDDELEAAVRALGLRPDETPKQARARRDHEEAGHHDE